MSDFTFDDVDEVPAEPLESKRDFIFQLPMFAGLRKLPVKQGTKGTPARNFLRICTEVAFEAGAIIAEHEDYADYLLIIRSGQLESLEVNYINNEQVFSRHRLYNPGDRFEDAWLFRPSTHDTLIRARKAGRMIMINSADFIKFIKTYPKALREIHPHLSLESKRIIQASRFQDYLGTSQGFSMPFSRKEPNQGAAALSQASEPEESSDDIPSFRPNRDQMNRIRKLGLLPDEYIEYYSNRSRTILGFRMALSLIVAAILFILPFLLLQQSTLPLGYSVMIAGLFAILPLGDLLRYWINWRNLYFVITNRRLVRSEWLIFRFRNNVEKVDIDKVQTVNSKKDGLIMNILNIGTAEITTAAQDNVLYFDFINNPDQVEGAIKKIRDAESAITRSRVKSAMRETVDKHFNVDSGMQEVREGNPPPEPKTWLERMREMYVKEEKGGVVIYHKHPIALVRAEIGPAVMAIILLILVYVDLQFFSPVTLAEIGVFLFLVVANVAWAWWQFEDWHNDTYQITNQYIYDVDRRPLGFGEDRKVAELSRIENVRTEQDGIFPTFFNYGNVQIETAGVDSNMVFENVRDPRGIQNQIFSKRDRFNRKQEEARTERALDQSATLLEMYEERRARGMIPRFQPLPDIDEE